MATGDPPNASGTITVTYYDCPHRGLCSDNGVKCGTCKYNPKRSYYEPVEPPIPYVPYYPYPYYTYWYVPYWQPTLIWNGTNWVTQTTSESHYQST